MLEYLKKKINTNKYMKQKDLKKELKEYQEEIKKHLSLLV